VSRQQRIEWLRHRLSKGEYQVDPSVIASAIMRRARVRMTLHAN
jgi:anti-sigma28 factor (negative regulator of flagellin synthesis)